MDLVDVVTCHGAKGGAQAADDPGLFAMRNLVVAHEVMADGFPVPAVLERAMDRLDIAFGAVGRGVIPPVPVLAQCDPRACRIANVVVLDDPTLAPVRAD